ncbi:MAG TPA: O-antigen ligase family protein [Candidatus Saccharimonadales bacterium]|nr:O-antigen ligase family protein [Candidatus Saccharimonadales bacterium]
MNTAIFKKMSLWMAGLVVLLCVAAPFHAFLTVWAGSVFGHYTAWRLWAEALLFVLFVVALAKLARDQALCVVIRRSPLTWCIAGYVILHLLVGAWALATHRVTKTALADGLILNLRLPLFLFVAQVFTARQRWLQAHWRKVVLVPAAVVVGFALLQIFVLPVDFLRHFGYGPHTIASYETVDQKLAYVRAQSSLRGANPLGAYLVVVLTAIAGVGFAWRKLWAKALFGIDFVLGLVVLAYTYSRSAYIGAVVALAAFTWWSITSTRLKRAAMVAAAAVLIVGAGTFAALRHNSRFENTFFHTDEHSTSAQSSNAARSTALQNGVRDVVHHPFGAGPGSAGPASAHNNHPTRIAENYFLQIGQEVGWLGLGLVVAIMGLAAAGLWQRKRDPLARVLLASLVGLTLVNLLSHAWTDDTLAIVWWTLAGAALAPDLSSKSKPARS